jgi:predicted site-specific integrase-resolvase
MILKVNGETYFSTTQILQEVGISRQTLWRWRQEGKIPAGHRYRDGKVLFTEREVEAIKQFAHHIEPIGRPDET